MSPKAPNPDFACTIVLADDHDSFRAALAEVLRLEGAHVVEASGGAAAIAVLDQLGRTREGARLVLVTDLMMPGVNGIDVLKRLRGTSRGARMPVLIMTAMNDPMLAVRLKVPVVFKQDFDALLNAIRRIARQSVDGLLGTESSTPPV